MCFSMPFIRHSELNCAFFPFKDNAKILKHALLISIFSEWRLENPLLAMLKPKLWLPGANPSRIRIPIPIRGHRLAKWTALRLVQT